MLTSKLDFELPEGRIATAPAEPRDSARVMVIERATGRITHTQVRDLPTLGILCAGDVMIVNRSAVLPAYLEGTRTSTGGRVKALYLEESSRGVWQLMIESRGTLKVGESITLDDEARLTLQESVGPGLWRAQLNAGGVDTLAVLHRLGRPPLPPYIRKARKAMGLSEFNAQDAQRYNTVYAQQPGSVAAPTAGLHFTPALLQQIEAIGVERHAVTLHVGMGTFLPVRSDVLDEHPMHPEPYHVPASTLSAIKNCKQRGGRVFVVGTTSVRTLESLPDPLPEHGDVSGLSNLFIRPDDRTFAFRYTDVLMTNFHLPRSTLLALVASLPGVGIENLMKWYYEAITQGYRFYSYGDAMILV
jgi:S-adenosylmethionine:tRNA ribosyltransferase-isomerase